MLKITKPTVTREQVGSAFRRTPDGRLRERYHCLVLLREGKSGSELAPWRYREEETMRRWGHAGNDAGLPGREREPIPGRPSCLTADQRAQGTEAVRRCPRESGSQARLWTTKRVRPFISMRFGIESGRERVRQVRHALGVRLRRRPRHLKAKAEEQASFRTELEAGLAEGPEASELLCVDAAPRRRHPPLTAPWCLVAEGPEVPTGEDHTKGQVDGAVAPLTGRLHYQIRPSLAKEEVAKFLHQLVAYYPGKRLLVIHDRGPHQRGAAVEEVVREACGQLVRNAQPADSPELNPQEHSWTWRRRVVTHNPWFAPLQEQIDAIRNFFRYLAGVKAQGRRLCGFKIPDSLVASL